MWALWEVGEDFGGWVGGYNCLTLSCLRSGGDQDPGR